MSNQENAAQAAERLEHKYHYSLDLIESKSNVLPRNVDNGLCQMGSSTNPPR